MKWEFKISKNWILLKSLIISTRKIKEILLRDILWMISTLTKKLVLSSSTSAVKVLADHPLRELIHSKYAKILDVSSSLLNTDTMDPHSHLVTGQFLTSSTSTPLKLWLISIISLNFKIWRSQRSTVLAWESGWVSEEATQGHYLPGSSLSITWLLMLLGLRLVLYMLFKTIQCMTMICIKQLLEVDHLVLIW